MASVEIVKDYHKKVWKRRMLDSEVSYSIIKDVQHEEYNRRSDKTAISGTE